VADHTLLDLWVVTPSGSSDRPWLTVIEDVVTGSVLGSWAAAMAGRGRVPDVSGLTLQ
jgi:hypothetical protein